MNRFRAVIPLILLCLVFVYIRGVHINADAPHDISFSGGVFSDEGDYSINARNRILYGVWFTDQWNDMYYNPALTFLRYIVFYLFDTGIAQQRWISIFFSLMSIVFVYLALSEDYNRRTALLGIVFLGFNYLYIMYSRNGLLEVPTIALSSLFIYCFQKGFKIPRFFLYAGAFTLFTYTFKNLYAYLLPVTAVAFLFCTVLRRAEYKKYIKPAFFLLTGYMGTFLAWHYLHFLPLKGWIMGYAGEYMKELLLAKSLGHALYNFKSFPVTQFYGPLTHPVKGVFVSMPVMYVMGFIFIGIFLYLLFYSRKLIKPTDVMAVSYFFAVFIFVLFILAYRPTRYFTAFVIPLSIMSARSIDLLLKLRHLSRFRLNRKNILFIGVLYLWGFFFYYLCILPFCYFLAGARIGDAGIPLKPSLFFWTVLYLFLVGLSWLITGLIKRPWRINIKLPALASAILVLLSLGFNVYYYYQWYSNPNYDVYNSAMAVKEILPEDAIMAGLISPVLAMESRIRPFFMFQGFMNYENNPCIRHNVTHAVLGIYNNEAGMFFDTCPEKQGSSTLISIFNIFKKDFLLYSFTLPVLRDARIADISPQGIDCVLTVYIPSSHYCEQLKIGAYMISEKGRSRSEPFLFDGLEPFAENELLVSIPFEEEETPSELFFYIDSKDAVLSMDFKASRLLGLTGSDSRDSKFFNDTVRKGTASSDPQGFLTYGPYLPMQEGMVSATYTLGFDGIPQEDTDAFVLDIAGDTGKTIFARRSFRTSELEGYKDGLIKIPLEFFLGKRTRIEFRTFFFSTVNLYVHNISLEFRAGKFIGLGEQEQGK